MHECGRTRAPARLAPDASMPAHRTTGRRRDWRRRSIMAGSTEPGGSSGPSGRPRLRRSRDERLLSGVCAGLGEYLGVDANVVRIAFALAALVPPLTAI